MSNFGSLNKQKIHSTHTSSTHGANFFQKRFNQLPSLFSNNISERDEDEYTSPPAPPPPLASTSSTTKKEKFRIRNFLSVSTSSQNSSQENNDGRNQKKITHQSSLNSTLTSKSTIQVIIGEPKKLTKSRLKECLNQKNVRRKSSSINTGCVNFTNSCNKLSNSNTFKRQHLNANLIEKAARRGSIHFYDKKKKNSNEELDDFRQRLLKLQRLQLEFLKANPLLSSNGTYRRKRAFVINEDFDNDDQNFRILPRLSHAISSLSLIVNDDECASGDKLHNQTKVSLTNSLTDVNEDLINEKNNEIGRVTKWATGFEKLLEDPLGLQIFTEFLKKEFSEENIDFWVKCENFKKLIDLDEMKKEASNIWRTYLDTSSMCQINVDNKARSSCQEALQTPNNTMFELAQTQIFTLMKYDSYSRFLKSQMYKDCIVNEMEGKPILSNPSRTGSNKKHPDNSSNVNSNQSNNNNNINNINNSNNLNVNENSNQTSSLIPNASSNLATAVAVVASTGAALITNVTISTSTPTNDSMTNSVNTSNQNNNNNNQISSSNTCNNNKEKKRSTLIPWTKAFIKWKRLSGKDKKASQIQNSENQPVNQVQIPNAPSVTTTPVKGVNQRTPLTLSGISETNLNLNGSPEINLEQPQASITLTNIIESKFCRVLCSNDGSSSVIQPLPGQTVYQVLSKIFTKKNIPWYKCDLYFVEDYSPIDPNMDAQILGSKEISLVERSLFALSLIPIAINLCVKANMKKTIGSILQPILDFYQIKNTNCGLFLNSGNCPLNINDLCSSIDGQHILVVHKQQANFFSQNEIDKLIKVSISDFIPNNLNDYHLQFDEMGVLKQLKKNNSVSPLLSPTIPSTLQIQSNNLSVNNIQSVFQSASRKILKSTNDDQDL